MDGLRSRCGAIVDELSVPNAAAVDESDDVCRGTVASSGIAGSRANAVGIVASRSTRSDGADSGNLPCRRRFFELDLELGPPVAS